MSNEIALQSSLTINVPPPNGNLHYQTPPQSQSFTRNMPSANGPAVGVITAQLNHTVVSLSQLIQPGLAEIYNLDAVNKVEVGIYNSNYGVFIPVLEIFAGEHFTLPLSRYLGHQA